MVETLALLWLLASIYAVSETEAWLTNYGFRELIHAVHRTPNQSRIDVQEALRLNLTKEQAVQQLRTRLNTASRNRKNQLMDRDDDESTTTSTTVKFNDPNFIPGQYLDASGQAKFVTPAPITDILVDFMAEIDKRQEELWQVGVYIMLNWILQGSFIILAAWIFGLFFPLYQLTQKMGETLPMEDEDRVDKMLELAEMYEENPIRFAHLPGFQIPGFDPLSSDEDEKKKELLLPVKKGSPPESPPASSPEGSKLSSKSDSPTSKEGSDKPDLSSKSDSPTTDASGKGKK